MITLSVLTSDQIDKMTISSMLKWFTLLSATFVCAFRFSERRDSYVATAGESVVAGLVDIKPYNVRLSISY
jgi:hypothetical protein